MKLFFHSLLPAMAERSCFHGEQGGYGDPLDRSPEAVLKDLRAKAISAATAEIGYGVVLKKDEIAINVVATRARHALIRGASLILSRSSR